MPHHETPPVAMLPGTYVMDQATVDRLVTSAAMTAAKAVRDDSVSREQVRELAEEVIEKFLERAFDVPEGDSKALMELRKDITWVRDSRLMREAMIKHGLLAIVGLLVVALGTAVWLAIKGGR
jgi:hypothetical protein